MEKKQYLITFIRDWGIICFLGLVLFMHLLVNDGRLSNLLKKVDAIDLFYTEQVKDIITRPYVF